MADLIEILSDYAPTAHVWMERHEYKTDDENEEPTRWIRPIELVGGNDDKEVFLA